MPDSVPRFETICVHHAEQRERNHGAAAPPLYQASTFTYPDCESFETRQRPESTRFDYTRVSNPTTQLLEQKVAAIEGGEACRAFGSGMAAISAAIMSCVKSGDHVVCIDTVYGPTRTFLQNYLPRYGVDTTFIAGLTADDYAAHTRSNTRLYYLESPSSLVFGIQDLATITALARQRGIATMIDNSYGTAYFQRPLALGADMVLHTATKYIGGHSDLVAGLVIGGRQRMAMLARQEGELLGGVCDPFAAWLMLRGLRTLGVRLDRHQASGLSIAQWLAGHPRVESVLHPGLPAHPGYELGRKQMTGTSGMLSFTLRDGTRESVHRVVNALRYFCIAVSWGGYESLAIPIQLRRPGEADGEWGIRLSVGLEHVDDLRGDLEQALSR